MSRITAFYRSLIGKKAIVAVTGALLLGFLVMHVVGNLKVFVADPIPGVPDIDVYSEFLRSAGVPLLPHGGMLWIVRIGLLAAFGVHVVCVIQLAHVNRAARPVRYVHRPANVEVTPAARWMLYTGSFLILFIVIHLLQFTTGTLDAARFTEGAVYSNLSRAFELWYYVAFYGTAMAVLALHLYHGIWSLFQSLGLDNPDRNSALRGLAVVVAVGLFIAFVSVPTAFFAGLMQAPPAHGAHAAAPTEAGR